MATVILVDPSGWQGAAQGFRPFPNVGIAYLTAVLHEHGHDVVVHDCNNEKHDDADLVELVAEHQPLLVGFSAKTATFAGARTAGQALKKSFPDVTIAVGGPHASLGGRDLLREPWIDIVCRGEGEEILPTICERLPDLTALGGVPGVATRHDDAPSLEAVLLRDVDNLPFPEYELFPEVIREALETSYPLVTSRGCSYKCTFCSVPKISGKRLRRQHPDNVLRELVRARERYGSQGFEVIDDLFNLDMKRCKTICRALVESELNFRWDCPNGLRADRVDPELAGLMAAAGCDRVMVGIESADPEVLESVRKGETIDEVELGIRTFKAAGIEVGGFFIIGLPGDSYQAEEKSVEFARRLGIAAHFNMLVPYPGTELYEWSKRDARLLRDVEEGIHFADTERMQAVVETDDFLSEDRVRAYEMTNTRMRYFHMLIPASVTRWERLWTEMSFIWKYDRATLPVYLFQRTWNLVKRRAARA